MTFGSTERLDVIKEAYVRLFEELVHPNTSEESRSMI